MKLSELKVIAERAKETLKYQDVSWKLKQPSIMPFVEAASPDVVLKLIERIEDAEDLLCEW